MKSPKHFIPFSEDISHITVPEKFTFPFSYIPHKLSLMASSDLQQKLKSTYGWDRDYGFGQDQYKHPFGKMFGVLVVRCNDELGYIAAFSGKLAGRNDIEPFVPPIFDRLETGGFFKKGEAELNQINSEVKRLEQHEEYAEEKALLRKMELILYDDLSLFKAALKTSKRERRKIRQDLGEDLSDELKDKLKKQSLDEQHAFKRLKKRVEEDVASQKAKVAIFEDKIKELKQLRKKKSGDLQQKLFEQYDFLSAENEVKNVLDIFSEWDLVPPAGAGDCAAPKLLQYAYKSGMKPVAMAEFWWGASPKMEIRKHGEFYPSCRGKCEPILGHMLQGLELDPNPIKSRNTSKLKIAVIYEDEHMAVISKPAGLLSAPGKTETDCVQSRMKDLFSEATGPLIVHRLDMATSGLLLIAKNEKVYKVLQHQFLTKEIKKRYSAVLDGVLHEQAGEIDLPLRVDFDNRPQQLVCYEYGKSAKTRWELIEVKNGKSKVYFYPITGRTHQLRVHAAHPDGLNMPIVGDVLYGKPSERLFLHAESISFIHPISEKRIEVELIDF